MAEKTVEDVFERHQRELMASDGVVGAAIGMTAEGRPCIILLLVDSSFRQSMPAEIEGFPVEIKVTGRINRMRD